MDQIILFMLSFEQIDNACMKAFLHNQAFPGESLSMREEFVVIITSQTGLEHVESKNIYSNYNSESPVRVFQTKPHFNRCENFLELAVWSTVCMETMKI